MYGAPVMKTNKGRVQTVRPHERGIAARLTTVSRGLRRICTGLAPGMMTAFTVRSAGLNVISKHPRLSVGITGSR
jgi:hypothetical protein